jgi:hypothetical protein
LTISKERFGHKDNLLPEYYNNPFILHDKIKSADWHAAHPEFAKPTDNNHKNI